MKYDPSTGYIYDDDGNVIARDMKLRNVFNPAFPISKEQMKELPAFDPANIETISIDSISGQRNIPSNILDNLTEEELIALERDIAIRNSVSGIQRNILPDLSIADIESIIGSLPSESVATPGGAIAYAAMSSTTPGVVASTNAIAPTQDTLTVTNTATPATTTTTSNVNYIQQAETLYPNLPPQILQLFAQEWANTGSPTVAIANVRKTDIYEQYFPGNTRADGTIRFDEVTYTGLKESYIGTLAEYGIPRDTSLNFLSDKFISLIQGEVKANEFKQRIEAAYTGIQEQIPEVQRFYGEQYGIDLTPQAILLGAIDPTVGQDIVSGRITTAQIGGEALRAGFDITETYATRLRKAGITQSQARQLFGLAESTLPSISSLEARRGIAPAQRLGVQEFTEAAIFGSPETEQRISRARAERQTEFSPIAGATRRGRRISGLVEE